MDTSYAPLVVCMLILTALVFVWIVAEKRGGK